MTQPAISSPLVGTESAKDAIARVSYTHDAMIDLIIARPDMSRGELAKHFGYTGAWISRVFNSDAFLARLASRKSDLVDPTIIMALEEKMSMAAGLSYDILIEKLETTRSVDLALKVADMAPKSLGYGARQQNVAVQQNFVVAMPTQAATAGDWAAKHGRTIPGVVAVDMTIVEEAKITPGAA